MANRRRDVPAPQMRFLRLLFGIVATLVPVVNGGITEVYPEEILLPNGKMGMKKMRMGMIKAKTDPTYAKGMAPFMKAKGSSDEMQNGDDAFSEQSKGAKSVKSYQSEKKQRPKKTSMKKLSPKSSELRSKAKGLSDEMQNGDDTVYDKSRSLGQTLCS